MGGAIDTGGAGGTGGSDGGSGGGEGGAPLICEPASTQCDLDVVETCNGAGTEWEQGAVCEFGCDAGACLVCAEGDLGCLGDAARVCDMNAWELVQNCPLACLDGVCVACDPGDRRCTGGAPEVCDASGAWSAEPACAGGTPECIEGLCFECVPGAKRCLGGNEGDSQLCDVNGAWQLDEVCSFYCDVFGQFGDLEEGECYGECVDGEKQCGDYDYEEPIGTFFTEFSCDLGTWVPRDFPCACDVAHDRCQDCSLGQERCLGDDVQACEAGFFETVESCSGATPVCADATCVACPPFATRCNGTVRESCPADGAGWAFVEDCASSGLTCSEPGLGCEP